MSGAFIIDPTVQAIEGWYALLGIGVPNEGGVLYSSLSFFEKALEHLAAAFPGEDWLGAAADKYTGQNRKRVELFKELAELDRELIELIRNQASSVQTTRNILEGAKKTLLFVRPVAVDLNYIPIVGSVMSASFQAQACAAAMAAVGGGLAYLLVQTALHTAKFVSLLARLAHLLASAVADLVSDGVAVIKGIVEHLWNFIHGALAGLKDLVDKIIGWFSGLFLRWWSKLHSLFGGIPGLSGATSGLSHVAGLFSVPGLAGSSGLVSGESLVSPASLPSLAGFGVGFSAGSLAQLHAASTRQGRHSQDDDSAEAFAEQFDGPQEPVPVQGSQGMGGPQGMGGLQPASTKSKGERKKKKYLEGAAAGSDDAERAPIEAQSLIEARARHVKQAVAQHVV